MREKVPVFHTLRTPREAGVQLFLLHPACLTNSSFLIPRLRFFQMTRLCHPESFVASRMLEEQPLDRPKGNTFFIVVHRNHILLPSDTIVFIQHCLKMPFTHSLFLCIFFFFPNCRSSALLTWGINKLLFSQWADSHTTSPKISNTRQPSLCIYQRNVSHSDSGAPSSTLRDLAR